MPSNLQHRRVKGVMVLLLLLVSAYQCIAQVDALSRYVFNVRDHKANTEVDQFARNCGLIGESAQHRYGVSDGDSWRSVSNLLKGTRSKESDNFSTVEVISGKSPASVIVFWTIDTEDDTEQMFCLNRLGTVVNIDITYFSYAEGKLIAKVHAVRKLSGDHLPITSQAWVGSDGRPIDPKTLAKDIRDSASFDPGMKTIADFKLPKSLQPQTKDAHATSQ